jgi:Zn finger protein HypA/HybF involved in hydrogenase expression
MTEYVPVEGQRPEYICRECGSHMKPKGGSFLESRSTSDAIFQWACTHCQTENLTVVRALPEQH